MTKDDYRLWLIADLCLAQVKNGKDDAMKVQMIFNALKKAKQRPNKLQKKTK